MPSSSDVLDQAKPLDLHEGICDAPPESGCQRWPEAFRLANLASGELVRGRCRATNLCRYCQRLYVVETVEMLSLDAVEHAPTLWTVLTAREHLTRRDTYGHLRQIRRAVRLRWPDAEWFVQVEFQRRGALHLNLLHKGVPVGALEELHRVVSDVWCSRVDALPVGQWSGAIEDGVGAVRYVSKMLAHGLKAEQAPPVGWRGHRTSQTRGYLLRPASVMRVEARAALKVKRALFAGKSLELAEHEAAHPEPWALVRVVREGGVDTDRQRRESARRPSRLAQSLSGSGQARSRKSESAPREQGPSGPNPVTRPGEAPRVVPAVRQALPVRLSPSRQ